MTDVQFRAQCRKAPSCSRLDTIVGLSASANDLVVHHRGISRRGSCRDVCVLVFSPERADSSSTKKARTAANEARIPTRVGLELSGPDEPLIYEITFTENVSRHGARVVTKRRWSPNDSVLVKLPQESLPSRARITHCQPLKRDEFAMGVG